MNSGVHRWQKLRIAGGLGLGSHALDGTGTGRATGSGTAVAFPTMNLVASTQASVLYSSSLVIVVENLKTAPTWSKLAVDAMNTLEEATYCIPS